MRVLSTLFILTALSVMVYSCAQKAEQNIQPVFTGTNVVEGVWTMKIYNGDTLQLPKAGKLTFVAKSDTSGLADFDFTLDGNSNNVEHTVYDLKINIATVYFSRVIGGNSGTLVAGEKWKIDKMVLHDDNRPDTMVMRSDVTGDAMLLSKP
ncbi:MAG: hypothetical protein JNL72_13615 [Flavipsychrobacter sp.]|nr:hypothetical protein [Flavipsychrobacter sp.]